MEDGLAADLARLLKGPVLTDEIHRAIYSSGACLYRLKPRAVAQPLDRDDVVALVRYAAEQSIPLAGRGGGTSRCGNELTDGIAVDFSRFMNRVVELDSGRTWVRVQPGLIQAHLNKRLAPDGIYLPIDPSTKDVATIGGMIANNSSGPHAVKYGVMRDWVLSLEVVLPDGEVIVTGRAGPGDAPENPRLIDLETKVKAVLGGYNQALIDEKPFVVKNSAGYHLWDLDRPGGFDLTPMFVGSEGTLGLVTEARLRLAPVPERTAAGLFYFDDLTPIGPAVQIIREMDPSMIEIIERRIIDLAREKIAAVRPYLPDGIEALLLVEFQGDDRSALADKFRELTAELVDSEKLAVGFKLARDEAEAAELAKVRSISGPILNRAPGPKKPVAVIEDAAVHPSRLPEYIAGLRSIFSRFRVEAGIYGHAGDGELHVMVFFDLRQEEDRKLMVAVAEAARDLVLSLKGTVSGEHGDGRLRSGFLKQQYPELSRAFAEIKNIFDPQGIMNPGVIVDPDEDLMIDHLKFGADYRVREDTPFSRDGLIQAVETCSGCRKCFDYCPAAKAVGQEWATGRARVALLRELIAGRLDPETLFDPRLKRVMDHCLNCKRCLTECPSGVDVPWLALQAKAAYLAGKGLSGGDKMMARPLSEIKGLAPLINLANQVPPARWLAEKLFGLDRRRSLPHLGGRTLTDLLKERTPAPGSKPVVYFAGCLEKYSDPAEGLAAIKVLEANDCAVQVPEFDCCGVARISQGDFVGARAGMEANLIRLTGYADQKLPVVFSEPSCRLAAAVEYPKIVETEAARRAAEATVDIHRFLKNLLDRGELNTDLGEIKLKVAYHQPCHLKAQGDGQVPVELLRLIPGLEVITLPDNCCGLAGSFGMKAKNYDLSLEIGRPIFEAIERIKPDLIATSCAACAMQLGQVSGRETISPIALLARAYDPATR